MKTYITGTLIGLIVSLLLCAQINYLTAVKISSQTDGSDIEIENVMYKYGFTIDAMDCNTPTMAEKIKALFVK
jgi:hypothetical protein